MVPFFIAGAVVLGATALAWLLDRETKEERGRHDGLRRRNADLRSQLYAASGESAKAQAARRRQTALALAANQREYCDGYRRRLEQPAQEFRALAAALQADLADSSISPFRRNALRLLQARLEDTRNRLDAYQRYCEWYVEQLDRMLARDRYDSILSFPDPQSRLPENWYYNGKVALASVAELTGMLNGYGQGLELQTERVGEQQYSDARQRALMLQYPDQEAIPVQMKGGKNPRYFKGCILRGALHVEHILEKLPCSAFVERAVSGKNGDGYIVRCYPSFYPVDKQQSLNGGITAFLPRAEASFPGKRYNAGERLQVYPHYFDLLLSADAVTVTEQAESLELGGGSAAPVFLHVDGAEHDLYPLQQERDAVWQLRVYSEADGGALVTLQFGAWQIAAEVCDKDNQLRVTGVNRTGIDSVQLDQLPFSMRLISTELKDSVFCDALQFHKFLQFCRQQSLFGGDEAARKAAGQFFERWNKVTEFLIDEEGYRSFSLSPQAAPEESEWDCACPVNLRGVLQDLIDDAQSPPRLYLEEYYANRNGERRWLQVGELEGLPEALGGGVFRLSHKGIMRPGPEQGYQPVAPAQLRLRFPNGGDLANLGRQKRALQGFMGGRLLNRTLQQLLLMPHRYIAQPDPYWTERIAEGLQWQNPNWADPAKATTAKRVVEQALAETNLYLIQGPPGTGKTTCIVELLHQIFKAHPDTRVLVVSQQNTAVDNALDRFLERYPDAVGNVLRIANKTAKVQSSLQHVTTDAILNDYLEGRREHERRSRADMPARAEWIQAWIDAVHRPQTREPFDAELSELLVGDYKLVGATCVGLASRRHGMDRLMFDICIIDEGGRSTVPELLIPLMRSRKAIIIGDHYQLPPSIASRLQESDAKEHLPFLEQTFLKTSFFEHLYENLPSLCRGRLVEQYRMVEPIGDLVADLFYSQGGERGLFNGKPHDRSEFLDQTHTLRWHNVEAGTQEKEHGVGPSLFNRGEAEALVDFLLSAARKLGHRKKQLGDGYLRKTVAVITPYGAQKRLITGLLAKHAAIAEVMQVEVDTVDSFQGSEADIVLYSTVRTHGNISFLLDRQRLNVACSRARENLVFFGATKFLREREARGKKFLFSTIMERAKYDHGRSPGTAKSPPARHAQMVRKRA